MEVLTLECHHCGSAIKYTAGATHLKCEYCGSEYILKAKEDVSPIKNIDYMGKGSLFSALIPDNWVYRVFDDENDFSALAAVCKGLLLTSPDGTQLFSFPFAYFKNFQSDNKIGITFRKNYQLDPLSFIRYREYPGFDNYAFSRIREIIPQAESLSIKKVNDLDEILEKRAQLFMHDAEGKLKSATKPSYGKFIASFTLNSVKMTALYASVVANKEIENFEDESKSQSNIHNEDVKPSKSGNSFKDFIEFGMNGGILGAIKNGTNGNLSKFKLPKINSLYGSLGANWGRLFDIILITSNYSESLNSIFNDFCTTFNYGSTYYELQAEEMRKVEEIQIQGMQQRTQNSIAASRRLQQTLSETSDIINRGYSERSQIMDNSRRKFSEAIRGVNSFETTDGRIIEANVRYEHVYQKGSDFAGTTQKGASPTDDWVELKKKD